MPIRLECYVFSSHGIVLSYIAANPDCSVVDIAENLCLTRRTIWGIIGDLRREGMLHVRKEGRRHRYSVNLDAEFRHPVIKGILLRDVLGPLAARAAGKASRETAGVL